MLRVPLAFTDLKDESQLQDTDLRELGGSIRTELCLQKLVLSPLSPDIGRIERRIGGSYLIHFSHSLTLPV